MILVDYREQRSGVIESLRRLGVRCRLVSLPAGDYVVDRDIFVERKSSPDFINSLTGGRLFNQLNRMAGRGRRRLLIIEGLSPTFYPGASAEAVRGALVAITVSWGIPILFSECPEETAELLARIEKQQIKRSLSGTRKTYWGRKAEDSPSGKRKILESLPLIGPRIAESLLKEFGSLEKVFSATGEDLARVKGIGRTRADKIRDILKEEKAKYKINFYRR